MSPFESFDCTSSICWFESNSLKNVYISLYQLLDELGKELEDLRRYKIEHETFQGRKGSVGDLPARYQDLQAELQKLKEV